MRRRQQGIERLFELVASEGPLEAVGAMHSSVHAEFAAVRQRLESTYPELEVLGGEIGPVVGTYAGPGAIGIAVLRA